MRAAALALNGIRAVPLAHPSDTPAGTLALTRRLAAGDEAAFREFHALYFDRLYHFLLVVTRGEEHAAREALQETLLRVARYVRAFETEEIFWGWLQVVARSAARDGGRKRRRYFALLDRFARGPVATGAEGGAAREADRLRAVLDEGLAEMAPTERALLEGKYLRGATVHELAAQTDLTEKAVESRLLRARRALAESVLKKLRAR